MMAPSVNAECLWARLRAQWPVRESIARERALTGVLSMIGHARR